MPSNSIDQVAAVLKGIGRYKDRTHGLVRYLLFNDFIDEYEWAKNHPDTIEVYTLQEKPLTRIPRGND